MSKTDLSSIGLEILADSRNRLYMNMPYLDRALYALNPVFGEHITISAATDGESLYFNGAFLADLYLRSADRVNRMYLHIILHCMLRHVFKKRGHDSILWDLACDAAAESILDDMNCACIFEKASPVRQKFYGECFEEMKVLTAEGIYRKLLHDRRSEFEIATLQREFLSDDHGLWDTDGKDSTQSADQDEKWKNIASQIQTRMETSLSEEANGGEAVLEQVRISARNDVDYRAFLRRFASMHETLKSDADGFDYIYYCYGLQNYGNMPLIEFPETKEEKRIGDLVIAIDTSMSTSGELVREFLSCTYSILRSAETFTNRFNIHIVQCDDTLRSDTVVRTGEELKKYMDNVSICGGSATDFRPVFEYVEEKRKSGELGNLRGLIYFTDGMGKYPTKIPNYQTAFVLVEEPPLDYQIPTWAIKIVLDLPAFDRLEREVEWDDELEELPEL